MVPFSLSCFGDTGLGTRWQEESSLNQKNGPHVGNSVNCIDFLKSRNNMHRSYPYKLTALQSHLYSPRCDRMNCTLHVVVTVRNAGALCARVSSWIHFLFSPKRNNSFQLFLSTMQWRATKMPHHSHQEHNSKPWAERMTSKPSSESFLHPLPTWLFQPSNYMCSVFPYFFLLWC